MRITIQTPLKNNEIKELLDGSELDGIKFTFIGKKGIGLEFEAESMNSEGNADAACADAACADAACVAVKKAIKGEDWGKVLYFSVTGA